jgi:hypothetical protein
LISDEPLVWSLGRPRRRADQDTGVRDALNGQRGGVPQCFLHATQQAFLEAHDHSFAYSAAYLNVLPYDNLASALRKILRGYRREETVWFMAFRSHSRFVRSSAGERHKVPVPDVADLDALNATLLTACRADEARTLGGRTETIGPAMPTERGHRLSPMAEGFDPAEVMFPLANRHGCVTVRQSF